MAAQQPLPIEPIASHTFGRLLTVKWTYDGRYLVVQDDDSMLLSLYSREPETYWQYDTQSNTFENMVGHPLSVTLTEDQLTRFNVNPPSVPTLLPRAYASPNQRYVVYQSQPHALAVADLEKNMAFITDGFIQSEVDVYWNEESTSFVTAEAVASENQLILHYVNLEQGFLQQGVVYAGSIYHPNSAPFNVTDVYDISHDGQVILLRGGCVPCRGTDETAYALILWHPAYQPLNRFLRNLDAQTVIGGIFSDDEDSVLYVNQSGVMEYNLLDETCHRLNDIISSHWIDKAVFSPNGEWLAAIQKLETGFTNVYILRLSDYLHPNDEQQTSEC